MGAQSNFSQKDVKKQLKTKLGRVTYYSLKKLSNLGFKDPHKFPFSIKVLLESALRNCDGYQVTAQDIKRITEWSPKNFSNSEISFSLPSPSKP